FRGLTVLNLADSDLGDEAVRALALARSFPELRSLSLASQHLGIGATEALGRVDWPLAELDLSSCRLGDAAVAALAAWPELAGLRRLDLSYCKISDAGAAALVRSPHLRGLIELDLSNNSIAAAGAKAIAQSENLSSLRQLKLRSNSIGSEGAAALAGSPSLRNLVSRD